MASKKKIVKKKLKPIKVVKGKKSKAVKRKAVKRKAVKKKPVKRKNVAKKTGFETTSVSLHSELRSVRQELEKTDSMLSKKLVEKTRLENSLNSLLSKNFFAEKEILSAIKTSSAQKQVVLKKEISSLEKINKVYEEKKARIDQAKKKQNALKKQLQLLEKKAGV